MFRLSTKILKYRYPTHFSFRLYWRPEGPAGGRSPPIKEYSPRPFHPEEPNGIAQSKKKDIVPKADSLLI